MLFHFGYFAVGWIGVQIFFVLSGHLSEFPFHENRLFRQSLSKSQSHLHTA
jgi:hypothetical protein